MFFSCLTFLPKGKNGLKTKPFLGARRWPVVFTRSYSPLHGFKKKIIYLKRYKEKNHLIKTEQIQHGFFLQENIIYSVLHF